MYLRANTNEPAPLKRHLFAIRTLIFTSSILAHPYIFQNLFKNRVPSTDPKTRRASHMDYYQCPLAELHQEVQRRKHIPSGYRDQLCESLWRDDDAHGSKATTVSTKQIPISTSRGSMQTTEIKNTAEVNLLINERIIYWTMNTFFPTLQLFFASGRSCTIGSERPDAVVGLDPELRFRLTDCSREEDGRFFKTMLPEKFAQSSAAIAIKEVAVAQRTSIAVHPVAQEKPRSSTIVREMHTVVGLRLEGMDKMGYIWSRTKLSDIVGSRTWSDVRLGGLRNDVPAPLFASPQSFLRAGGEMTVVTKESMISATTRTDSVIDECSRYQL